MEEVIKLLYLFKDIRIATHVPSSLVKRRIIYLIIFKLIFKHLNFCIFFQDDQEEDVVVVSFLLFSTDNN